MEQNEIFGRNPIDTSGTPGGINRVGLIRFNPRPKAWDFHCYPLRKPI